MSLSQPVNPPTINPGIAKPASSGLLFGSLVARTQVNQIKGSTPNNANAAGIPKQVSNVQVSVANAQTGATCTITVLFRRDPTDRAFSGVNVWVRGYQGNNQLVQVASGADSPCKFVLNNTGETVSFTIQAYGNGGNAPLNQSPTNSGTLPKSTTGGFGSSTTNYYNVTNPPPTSLAPRSYFLGPGLDIGSLWGYGANAVQPGVTANQPIAFKFDLIAPITITTISTVVINTHATAKAMFGIYDSNKNKLLESGALSMAVAGTVSATITAVTLNPGTYYFVECIDTTGSGVTVNGLSLGRAACQVMFNTKNVKMGSAANSASGGVLPTTLGVLTGQNYDCAAPLFEV